jgi:Arc/MetJ family transcription regulator
MAKSKATITLDKETVAEAIRLTGAASSSAAIDLALRELIRHARAANDAALYRALPSTIVERQLAAQSHSWADLRDDVDWDAEFAEAPNEPPT